MERFEYYGKSKLIYVTILNKRYEIHNDGILLEK